MEHARQQHLIRVSGFVVRCAASAAVACWLSNALGLSHTVWAAMSALIVSQEKLDATKRHIIGRIAGTCIGALVALGVHLAGTVVCTSAMTEIIIAVGLCAVIACGRPILRVCLWTCPLVLLTGSDNESPEITALSRTLEVFLGALVGGVLHYLEVMVLRQLGVSGEEPPAEKPNPGSGD